MKERKWIDNKFMSLPPELRFATEYNNFKHFVRHMDDCISREHDDYYRLPEESDYCLKFKATGYGKEIDFIGLRFTSTTFGVDVRAPDKQNAFSFALIRYPSWHSNMPQHVVIGTIIGMLVRFLRYTTRTDDFLKLCSDGMKVMIENRQYRVETLRSAIVKFVGKHIEYELQPVSYTHLTLPTIYPV